MFSLTSTSVMRRVCFDTPKAKVTVEIQIYVCPEHNFYIYEWISKKECAHLFSLTSTSVMRKVCFNMPKVKVTVEDQMFKLTLSGA